MWLLILATLSLAAFLLRRVLYPTYDPREPPVLRPKLPFFGHFWSMSRELLAYFERMYKTYHMPTCTLPVFTGKMYLINSPTLMAAAHRCPDLSWNTFIEKLSLNALGVSKKEVDKYKKPGYLQVELNVYYPSLTGEFLWETATSSMKVVEDNLNGLALGGGTHVIHHVEMWLRDIISQVMVSGLYGEKNPMTLELLDDMEFEKCKVSMIMGGWVQRLFTKKALAGRARIHAALSKYYLARHDEGPTVSTFIKNRAAVKRELGVSHVDLVAGESEAPWTSLMNTVPSLFWMFVNVWTRPDCVERIRAEMLETTTVEGGAALVDLQKLYKMPFIRGCVHEAQRLYSKLCAIRRVARDTTLRELAGGSISSRRDSMCSGSRQCRTWTRPSGGRTPPNSDPTDSSTSLSLHMCPGRHLAVAELMGMVGGMALLFDVEGVVVPGVSTLRGACSMVRPAWKSDAEAKVTLRRRKEWENVELKFFA
ncbi:hypothetical protein N0V88_001877 [Collariella sp. IMI 366227]|nr:hypothetical protein N0V88_001877 [Collariella sp. IMI 366227]